MRLVVMKIYSFLSFYEREQYYRRAWSIWGEPGMPAGV
jgi:hypothetical protein